MVTGSASELREGLRLLDRYTIEGRVAGGGMSDIYRAHDERLDRTVVVKLLRNVIEDATRADGGAIYQATYTHFLQEARALSKLAHPNTLRIYDFGFLPSPSPTGPSDAALPFQISEFLDGGTLESYVRSRGALRPVEVLAIVDRIAGAISEAHDAGVIHRDIKPSNILFAKVGDVLMPKLADFGIAREVRRQRPAEAEACLANDPLEAGGSDETPPVPLFSPRWAAPEQIASLDEGPYTDVYGLGLVVAFMLAGTSLFETLNIERTYAARVTSDAFVRSRLTLHTFAPEVARTLMEALRAEPSARTQSPFALYEALSIAFGTPRATLPTVVSHSGGVPPAPAKRDALDSVSVKVAFTAHPDPPSIEPPEQWLDVDGRRVRIVETPEKLDLTFEVDDGQKVRLRVTWLPSRAEHAAVHFKGLNCFVAKPGATPTPAVTADADGGAFLVSPRAERLSGIAWSFGALRETSAGTARVFPVARGELVIPFPHGQRAVLIELSPEREVIVICRSA